MARSKITAYITPDLADALVRIALLQDRSVSDVVEGAIAIMVDSRASDTERTAVSIWLDQISRRLATLQDSQETLLGLIKRLGPNRPDPARVDLSEEAAPE